MNRYRVKKRFINRKNRNRIYEEKEKTQLLRCGCMKLSRITMNHKQNFKPDKHSTHVRHQLITYNACVTQQSNQLIKLTLQRITSLWQEPQIFITNFKNYSYDDNVDDYYQ